MTTTEFPAPSTRARDAHDLREAFLRPAEDFVDVGHSRLAYRRFGSGPDVVLIHGWPLWSATFRDVVPQLSGGFTCHLFDLPGAGETVSRPDAPIGFRDHVETVRAAVDALGLTRYALVAHDSGALVARMLAASDPRVSGVVASGTEIPGYISPLVLVIAAMARSSLAIAIFRRLLAIPAFRRSPLGFGGCFADPRYLDGRFTEILPALLEPTAFARQFVVVRSLDARLVEELHDVHARITCPVRFVWGEDDPIFPLERARAMVPGVRGGAELLTIPRGRTFVHEERPDEFVRLVRPFLARVSG